MTRTAYLRLLEFLRARRQLCRTVQLMTKGLPLLFVVCYSGAAVQLLLQRDDRLLRFLLVPALALGSCMLLRRILDLPRPYEVFRFQPLISRDKKGRSCPSNHTTSAVIIAMAFLYLSPAGGWMLIPAVLVAVSRVCCGVHWPRDVLAGGVLALTCGTVGFWGI